MSVIDQFFAPGAPLQKHLFFIAKRFVAGDGIASALAAVRELNARGMTATLDFLGEDVTDRAEATRTRDTYVALLAALQTDGARTNVSVKLTALGLLLDEGFCSSLLEDIVSRAQALPDPFVRIDMEGSSVTQATLRVFESVFARHSNVGPVIQAYLKRSPADVERALSLGARVRLCKGAYREPPALALQHKAEIRQAYLAMAEALLSRGTYPGLATHDEQLIAAAKSYASAHGIEKDRFEFQLLYGVRPDLQRALVNEGYRVRVYVPFGTHWAAYFYRRVTERRENALFALRSLFGR